MRLLRFVSLCLVTSASLAVSSTGAQQPAPVSRIHAPVDDAVRTTLKGNVPFLARPEYDQGEAAPSTQLTHIRLVLARSAGQEAALTKYLAALQDKSSPNYHKWLTPEQFGALYGPSDADVATLTSWLEKHGLAVEAVSKGRTNIAFSGNVSQVEEAFSTQIHSFLYNGEQFYSNIQDPRIPAALAPVVKGVAHLNTMHPRSYAVRGEPGVSSSKTGRLEQVHARPEDRVTPKLTLGDSTEGYFLYIVPGDAATIYDTPNAKFNANYTTGTNYSGTGVKIGIGGEALIQATTVADYRTNFIGDSTQPTIVNVDGVTSTTNTGALDEAYLDTELSGGLAPGASIYFYTSTDLTSAIEKAINDNTVDIFSLSFGECELDLSTSDNAMISSWWQQAATQGIAVTVSTGDSGSAGCDATSNSSGNAVTTAVGGLAVSGYASTIYNIAVGGTDLYGLSTNFSTYASTSQGSSSTYYRTALNYIPESTWNDSTVTNTSIAANAPWTSIPADTSYANISSGSGGASSCSTNTTVDTSTTYTVGKCTNGYSKPAWQRGIGVPTDGVRDMPDIALMAGNGFEPATWLVCSDDTTQNSSGATVTENCTKQSDGDFYFVGYGGTSTSAPAFAGILAIVEQTTGGRLGQAAKNLYDLYNGGDSALIFHDVTVGDNSVPCTTASPNCSLNTAGYDYLTGYNTGTGYDLSTGLGSVDVKQLVTYWNTSTGTATPGITVTPSATTITSTTSLTVAATLTASGSLAVPTGTVTLTGPGITTPSEALVSGAYTFSIPAGTLTVGADTLTLAYSGDSNYAASTATTAITVNGLTPTVSVVPSMTSLSANNALTLVATVAGSGATPTGTVTLTGAATSTAQNLSGGAYSFSVPANTLATGTDTFTVTYSGDGNYAAATGTVNVTVSASTATFTLTAGTPSPASVTPGGTSVANITVNTANQYGGTVILTCTPSSSNPANASGDVPLCDVTTSAVAVGSSTPVSVLTIAQVTSELAPPKGIGNRGGWAGAGGGAVLALLVFFGIPARRRSWQAMLCILAAMAALGSFSACGGGGGGGGQKITNPGTAAGTYMFTVTGTGTPAVTPVPTTTFTVVVN